MIAIRGRELSPELNFVFADENNLEVDVWKWNVTDLGQTLRSDGKVYPTLTLLQQAEMQTHIHALVLCCSSLRHTKVSRVTAP